MFVLLPGPPREMKPMFDNYAKPWIASRIPDRTPLYSKILKFSGIGESRLESELHDIIVSQKEVTVAPYAKEGEVALRLSAKAANAEAAAAMRAPIEKEIRSRVGEYLFSEEDVPLETVVVQSMLRSKSTLSAAESCTGGVLSDLITSVPGSSNVYKGGVICYTNEIKARLLGVPLEVLEGEGAPVP